VYAGDEPPEVLAEEAGRGVWLALEWLDTVLPASLAGFDRDLSG
jgi:hypothetical protein